MSSRNIPFQLFPVDCTKKRAFEGTTVDLCAVLGDYIGSRPCWGRLSDQDDILVLWTFAFTDALSCPYHDYCTN